MQQAKPDQRQSQRSADHKNQRRAKQVGGLAGNGRAAWKDCSLCGTMTFTHFLVGSSFVVDYLSPIGREILRLDRTILAFRR
jgi:hypothetical protein